MVALLFDIEATNLDADFGYILCFGYKRVGEKYAHIVSIRDFPRFEKDKTNDVDLLKEISKILREADLHITWYGADPRRFDLPFINSRLLVHNLPTLPRIPHVDGWKIARDHLKLHSNRLASVSEFLGIEEKTPLKPNIWIRAMSGHVPSISYVEQHCRQDVIVLEEAYNRLRSLDRNHPNIALMDSHPGCPNCGGQRLHSRGSQINKTRRYKRYQCQDCGSWCSDRLAERDSNRKVISWNPK